MGYVPDWLRANHAKNSTTSSDSAPSGIKYGIVSRELFHNAPKQKFADGGDVNIKGETMGEYSGDDEIVKYRMNQIDDKGNDLRSKFTKDTVSSDRDSDAGMDIDTSAKTPSRDFDAGPNLSTSPKSSDAKPSYTKSTPKPSSTASSSRDFDAPDDGTTSPKASDDRMKARAPAAPSAPAKESKKYIDIPKNNTGMRQYRDDAESPAGSFFKKLVGSQSQRTKAANKSKDD